MGARIFENRDPAKGKRIKVGRKLYPGKASLLPDFFNYLGKKKKFKSIIDREIHLITSCIYANLSLKKNKMLKINYLK